jgi:hypothetical protein
MGGAQIRRPRRCRYRLNPKFMQAGMGWIPRFFSWSASSSAAVKLRRLFSFQVSVASEAMRGAACFGRQVGPICFPTFI